MPTQEERCLKKHIKSVFLKKREGQITGHRPPFATLTCKRVSESAPVRASKGVGGDIISIKTGATHAARAAPLHATSSAHRKGGPHESICFETLCDL